MKLTKKKVFVVAIALSLIAILSFSTLAWFTATDKVVNNFYVADSDEDNQNFFDLDVIEEDEDGNIHGDEDDENGIEFDYILPGDDLTKKPVLVNEGLYDQWVRAFVTVSDASILMDAMTEPDDEATPNWYDPATLLNDIDEKWLYAGVEYYADSDELVYTFYYNEELLPGAATSFIFESVAIPEALTVEQAQAMGEHFSVTVSGQAIQAKHTGNSAMEAFVAFWEEDPNAPVPTKSVNNGVTVTTTGTYYTYDDDSTAHVYSLTNATVAADIIIDAQSAAEYQIVNSTVTAGTVVKVGENGINTTLVFESVDFVNCTTIVDAQTSPVVAYFGDCKINGEPATKAQIEALCPGVMVIMF